MEPSVESTSHARHSDSDGTLALTDQSTGVQPEVAELLNGPAPLPACSRRTGGTSLLGTPDCAPYTVLPPDNWDAVASETPQSSTLRPRLVVRGLSTGSDDPGDQPPLTERSACSDGDPGDAIAPRRVTSLASGNLVWHRPGLPERKPRAKPAPKTRALPASFPSSKLVFPADRAPPASFPDTICTPVTAGGVTYDVPALRKLGTGKKLLFLYSGPPREFDAEMLGRHLGAIVHLVDVLQHSSHDLADHHVWEDIIVAIQSGFYDGIFMSPPCSTFSAARGYPGGPPPLRGPEPPDIYGLPNLDVASKDKVRQGTLHALRAAHAARTADAAGIPWAIESPRIRQGRPSVFVLPEWLALRNDSGIRQTDPDQCCFGDHPPRGLQR